MKINFGELIKSSAITNSYSVIKLAEGMAMHSNSIRAIFEKENLGTDILLKYYDFSGINLFYQAAILLDENILNTQDSEKIEKLKYELHQTSKENELLRLMLKDKDLIIELYKDKANK